MLIDGNRLHDLMVIQFSLTLEFHIEEFLLQQPTQIGRRKHGVHLIHQLGLESGLSVHCAIRLSLLLLVLLLLLLQPPLLFQHLGTLEIFQLLLVLRIGGFVEVRGGRVMLLVLRMRRARRWCRSLTRSWCRCWRLLLCCRRSHSRPRRLVTCRCGCGWRRFRLYGGSEHLAKHLAQHGGDGTALTVQDALGRQYRTATKLSI